MRPLRYKRINSYTTRPRRNAQDKHIFVSDKEFNELQNIVAYTDYGGDRYCATAEQVDNADLYIIDLSGLEYFKQNYRGNKVIKVIGLVCGINTLHSRMALRGDNAIDIEKRIVSDIDTFSNLGNISDVLINSERDVKTVARQVHRFIKECEK